MTETMERIAGKLLENMEQRLDSGVLLEIKDYKSVTGALRELRELSAAAGSREEGLVVRFVGETEELAK